MELTHDTCVIIKKFKNTLGLRRKSGEKEYNDMEPPAKRQKLEVQEGHVEEEPPIEIQNVDVGGNVSDVQGAPG